MNNNNYVAVFKTISDFVNELSELFGDKQHSLKLYSHLINKTTISHEVAIKKHLQAFRTFCVANREALIEKNVKNFTENKVEYSTRVFIDFSNIFELSDSETAPIIWKHLLYISALMDPAGKAKEELQKSNDEDKNEANFLTSIFNKVEQSVDTENDDPMAAMTSIMQSGIINELMGSMQGGMQDGSLDMGKMMGMVTGLISNMENTGGDCASAGEGPDMTAMMAMMGNMMGGMNNLTPPVKDSTTRLEEVADSEANSLTLECDVSSDVNSGEDKE